MGCGCGGAEPVTLQREQRQAGGRLCNRSVEVINAAFVINLDRRPIACASFMLACLRTGPFLCLFAGLPAMVEAMAHGGAMSRIEPC